MTKQTQIIIAYANRQPVETDCKFIGCKINCTSENRSPSNKEENATAALLSRYCMYQIKEK
jgi:hypothetical protein